MKLETIFINDKKNDKKKVSDNNVLSQLPVIASLNEEHSLIGIRSDMENRKSVFGPNISILPLLFIIIYIYRKIIMINIYI